MAIELDVSIPTPGQAHAEYNAARRQQMNDWAKGVVRHLTDNHSSYIAALPDWCSAEDRDEVAEIFRLKQWKVTFPAQNATPPRNYRESVSELGAKKAALLIEIDWPTVS